MKSIILKPHELENIDRLTYLVRPMKKQPIEVWNKEGDIGMYDDGRIAMRFGNTIVGVKPPFSPGETAWVKETWGTNGCLNCPIHYKFTEPNWKKESLNPNARWYSACSMPQWASRYHITFVDVEAKQLKDLTNEEIRGNCIKPDMVDSGGQTPWGNWIEVPDYGHPFLEAYNVEPNTWLWLWKVEVKRAN